MRTVIRTCNLTGLTIMLLACFSRVAGAAWPLDPTANLPLCTAGNFQGSNPQATRQPQTITSVGAGCTIITWEDYRAGGADIYAQRILADGTLDPVWPLNGRALCVNASNQTGPTIIADGAGGAIVTWMDSRNFSSRIYAQRVKADGTMAWTLDGVALCPPTTDGQLYPTIATDGAGGAIVAWEEARGGNFDIYAQRIRAGGLVDPNWPVTGSVLCSATNNQVYPQIAQDGAGGAIVTWWDWRNMLPGDTSTDIYAQRVLANGVMSWAPNGVSLCRAAGEQQDPTISADGFGGAIVAWEDRRLYYQIYAQRVRTNGTTVWPTDGVALSGAPPWIAASPVIAADGDGGAIVAWPGGNIFVALGIFAQHVLAAGVIDPRWPTEGRALGTIAVDSTHPTTVSDGQGGAIVTWEDNRNDDGDIYAQRVSPDGTPRWLTDGAPVCTAENRQYYPLIAADGPGNAVITWTDTRNGNEDVYAQRIQANGSLGGGVVDVPRELAVDFALDPVRPNPMRGRSIVVSFTLAVSGNASLELFDVAGRRLTSRDLGSLGTGRHAVELGIASRLAPGIYLVRLRQGSAIRVSRVAVLG